MGIAGGADMAHFQCHHSPRSALYAAAACCATAGSGYAPDGAASGQAMRWSPVCCDPPSTPACVFSSMPRWSGCCRVRRACPRGARSDGGRFTSKLAPWCWPAAVSHDRQRLAQVVPHAAEGYGHFSAAPPDNQARIRLGESVGGQFDTSCATRWPGAGVRVTLASGQQLMFLIWWSAPNRVIAVLPNGKRFVNEADSYHDFIAALLAATPAGDTPQAGCWPIVARCVATAATPDRSVHSHRRLRTGYLQRGNTRRSWRSSALSTPMRWRKPLNATTSPALAKTSIFTAGISL